MKNPATIYLADDDFDDRSMLRDALTAKIPDVEIVEAFDGQDLIDKIKPAPNSSSMIILTDWNMPRLNGLEVAKIMKSDPEYKEHKMIQQPMLPGSVNTLKNPYYGPNFLLLPKTSGLVLNSSQAVRASSP